MQANNNYRIAVLCWVVLVTCVTSRHLTELLTPEKLSALTEAERYDLVYRWCAVYDSCDIDLLQQTKLSGQDQNDKMVIRVKKLLGITSSTSELTDELMLAITIPRCAQSKQRRHKRFSRLGSVVWQTKNLPLGIKFRNYAKGFTKKQQEAIAIHCANLWGKDSGLSFRMVTRDPNIEIRFSYIDGAFNTVGRGQSPTPNHRPPTTHMTLDTGETWKLKKGDRRSGVSMTWAICHEMGHTLGLSHSSDRTAIMYASGRGQDEDRLGTDDLNGIRYLYPKTRQGEDRQSQRKDASPRRRRPRKDRRRSDRRRSSRRSSSRRRSARFRYNDGRQAYSYSYRFGYRSR